VIGQYFSNNNVTKPILGNTRDRTSVAFQIAQTPSQTLTDKVKYEELVFQ